MTDTKLLSIKEAAKRLGVSIDTLRRWDKKGILSPMRTPGGQRRYTQEQIEALTNQGIKTSIRQLTLTGTIAIQSGSTLLSATGVPSSTIGANGDYYFRTDGTTSNTTLYYKTGGSWTAAGGGTLQNTYDVSSSPEFTVDTTRGGITIRDAATAIGANLLEVQNNAGTTTYFAVTTSGASATDLSITDSTPAISAATTNASLSINANGTGTVDIAGTSTGNVNLAGGSGFTGCTITNATGALTCSSDITAGATGTVGYWTKSGTTLSPATSGDAISTSGNITASGTGTITAGGLVTAQNRLTLYAIDLLADHNWAKNLLHWI